MKRQKTIQWKSAWYYRNKPVVLTRYNEFLGSEYRSVTECASALGISYHYIHRAAKEGLYLQGVYSVEYKL